jgi:UDP-N-acetylmuramoyl-tripeptide--D-alanyl-D-alanine ligase
MTPDEGGSTRPALPLTAAWVAAQMGGMVIAGDPARVFDNVSIDTRTLAAGDLYVGIRGERFDGAEFAGAAIGAGAAGVVVPRTWTGGATTGTASTGSARALAERSPAVVIEVDDTTAALQALAHGIRCESGTKVVAITGSAGKTTTKEVTSEFLEARYRVVRNRGNFNNHIGLPLSLIELRQRPEMAVVELGMNHAGEISTLVRIAEPDVRVWTNVGEAHLGFFASLDAIADAKAEILEGAAASTLLVANADDPLITARIGAFRGRVVTFGIEGGFADVRASAVVDRGIEGTSARVTTRHGAVEITTPLIGRANLANILAATAVAEEFGVPLDSVAARAAQLRPASHRGEVVRLASGVTIIDDSYNANPTATKKALDVLASGRATRRIAIIGEMLELGVRSSELHEDVGRAAADATVDLLLAIGGSPARAMADAAVASGMAPANVRYFATSDEAAAAAVALVQPGDLVLVKGSRGVKTDRVVDRLKAERG